MNTMRQLLTALAGVLVTANVYALPASQQSVEALLAVTKTESLVESIYANMDQLMRQSINQSLQGKTPNAEQQRAIDAMTPKVVALVRQEVNWEKLKPLYVQLYRDTFEQHEVDGLIAFYNSPAGRAFVDKMPALLQKSMALTQSLLQPLLPKLMAIINSALADAKIAK